MAYKPQLVIKMEEMCCAEFIMTRKKLFKNILGVPLEGKVSIFFHGSAHVTLQALFKMFCSINGQCVGQTGWATPPLPGFLCLELDTSVTVMTKSMLFLMIFVDLPRGQ